MIGVTISPEAAVDLRELWDYLARSRGDQTADRVLERIEKALLQLTKMPRLGHLRDDLADEPLWLWSVSPYVILYVPRDDRIEVVRVVHAARDINALFQDRADEGGEA